MAIVLNKSVSKLRAALSVKKRSRGRKWAENNCILSRYVHLYVWRFCPELDYVLKNIIPLLQEALEGVEMLMKPRKLSQYQRRKFLLYAENIRLRINNLKDNYLKRKPSSFLPEDMLTGKRPKVG